MDSKINVSLRSGGWILILCLLFQLVAATSVGAAPIPQEDGIQETRSADFRVRGQPPVINETPKTQSVPQDTSRSAPSLDSPPALPDPKINTREPMPTHKGESPSTGWTPMMSEGFEGFFPSGLWDVYDNDGAINGEYKWDDDDYRPYEGGGSAWPANGGANRLDPEFYNYPPDADSWMVYGPFDLTGNESASLEFRYWNLSEYSNDYFGWYASSDGVNFYGERVSGNSGGWEYIDFDLTPYKYDTSVWIAFIFTSDDSVENYGPFVDNITLWRFPSGFNSQFTYDDLGWNEVKGTWSVVSGNYRTTGIPGKVSSSGYAYRYPTLDYQARLKRLGCQTCANRLYIRGRWAPLNSDFWWYRGYFFQYTNNQYFSVWKTINGVSTELIGWTYYGGIKPNTWNKLRVKASGSTLKFYINGALIWSGSDRSLSTGTVGIGMQRDTTSSGNYFDVDWATLSTIVSLEQFTGEEPLAEVGETVHNWDDMNMSPAP